MTVGLAISGGSSTAMLATACTLNWLQNAGFLTPDADVVMGTCSGGTLGTTIYNGANDRLDFPSYDVARTYEQVVSEAPTAGGKMWFAEALTPKGLFSANFKDLIWRAIRGEITWEAILRDSIFHTYGIKEVNPGKHKWVTNMMYVPKDEAPPKKNKWGYIDDPIGKIGQMWRQFGKDVGSPAALVDPLSDWNAVSYSTHIASYLIFEYPTAFSFDKYKKYIPDNKDYYFSDGGYIDETAISNVLIQKATSVLSYISWPSVFALDGRVGNLFGYTGNGNHTLGPKYSQFFDVPHDTLMQGLKNLTDPNVFRARFENVKVLKNDFFGIEAYELKTLMILVDQRSPNFINSFQHPKMRDTLKADKKFPCSYENIVELKVTWPTFGANSYCMFQQYKGELYRDEIAELFRKDKAHTRLVEGAAHAIFA